MATLRLFFASAKNANQSAKRNGDGRYGGETADAGDAADALEDVGEHRDPLNDGDVIDYASSEDSQS